jgi:hypothetical protein
MCGLSRRDVIAATLATVTAGLPARAQEPRSSALYFVPGGRIGFQHPATIRLKPLADSWHLLSSDHTFQVDVTEALRINPDWDDQMWQPDRDVLVSAGYLSPDIERRPGRSQSPPCRQAAPFEPGTAEDSAGSVRDQRLLHRSQMLEALERVFSSLSLPDSAAAKE